MDRAHGAYYLICKAGGGVAAADGDGARALRLFTAGGPRVGKGPFLGDWGGGAADLNGDGIVDGADLTILLGSWGDCP